MFEPGFPAVDPPDGPASATATDGAGYVQATVLPGGRLHALYVSPHAMYDLTADQLATACLEAVVKAQTRRFDVSPFQP
ncbi:hypothetical protein [Asanoa hainanensis]|nr:hypothetical protein [Asanoa hainanensis]